MSHTQTDNLDYIFSMLSQVMHFTLKNNISNKTASLCQLVAVCLLWLDDLAVAVPFLDVLSQNQH